MRSRVTSALLAFFFGFIGVHKFYLGQKKKGILYILFSWTLVPYWIGLVEAIILIGMKDNEFNKKYNQ